MGPDHTAQMSVRDPNELAERYRRLRRQVAVGDLEPVLVEYDEGRLRWLRRFIGDDAYVELDHRLGQGDQAWIERTLAAGDPARRPRQPVRGGSRHRSSARRVGINWSLIGAVVASLVVVALLVSRCGGSDGDQTATTDDPADATVVETIARTEELSTFASLVETAGLTETLSAAGPYTVFAPNNAAFAAVPATTLDALRADPAELARVLSSHVIEGAYTQASFDGGTASTLGGTSLDIAPGPDGLTINGSKVVSGDLVAGNGVVHVIDAVLLPGSTEGEGTFTVYFDSGSATVGPEGQQVVAEAAAAIGRLAAGSTIVVTGYADSTGDPAANLTLSEQRAANVQAELEAQLGDAAVTFDTSAQADPAPSTNQAENRRVVITLP